MLHRSVNSMLKQLVKQLQYYSKKNVKGVYLRYSYMIDVCERIDTPFVYMDRLVKAYIYAFSSERVKITLSTGQEFS